jgi:DUF4097 and DUF4098 domain-containing protein YvlB
MEKTFETAGRVRLYVQNEVGLVSISTREMTTTVVSLEADTPEGEDLVEHAAIECRASGSRHIVAVKVPSLRGMRFRRHAAVIVRIEVPAGSDVKVFAGSADVEITGSINTADLASSSGDSSTDDVAADAVAKSASGDITVGAVGGDLRVHTASGGLRCSSVAGSVVFVTSSGDLEVGAVANKVEVKATSGNVRLGELSHGARIANVSGDVRVLTLGEGSLQIRSVSGDVSVGVAKGVHLHVDVETMSGLVHSDIPLDDGPGPGSSDNQVDLSVRSVSGNVEIARALEQIA